MARYKEDVSWTSKWEDEGWVVHIIQKEVDVPNLGREPSSYMHWLIDHNALFDPWYQDGYVVFCQGNPFDHYNLQPPKEFKDFEWYGPVYTCNRQGQPQDRVAVGEAAEKWFGVSQDSFTFHAGCQFMVSFKNLARYDVGVYYEMYDWLLEGRNCYTMERLWGIMFDTNQLGDYSVSRGQNG